jgi:Tfp pilus assembly protein PilN
MRDKLKKLSEKTKDFEKLEAAFNAAQKQQEAIERLRNARSTPAWLLYELATILTKDRNPTMTPEMAKRVREDPNRGWVQGWDPKHVWITQFSESRGRFKLSGAAQSDSDMTQLALRLQASVYFDEVLPQTGKEAFNKAGGVSYYNFVITGKVVY